MATTTSENRTIHLTAVYHIIAILWDQLLFHVQRKNKCSTFKASRAWIPGVVSVSTDSLPELCPNEEESIILVIAVFMECSDTKIMFWCSIYHLYSLCSNGVIDILAESIKMLMIQGQNFGVIKIFIDIFRFE